MMDNTTRKVRALTVCLPCPLFLTIEKSAETRLAMIARNSIKTIIFIHIRNQA